jgi:four helix bundle suffix protein
MPATAPHQGNAPVFRPHGGYRTLRAFQVATVIYDATVWFCERFIDRGSRTRDQMVQAARSGRQNIAEGARRSATSTTTEIKLLDVARASLEELLLDYEDYLRQRHLPEWDKNSPDTLSIRRIYQTDQPASSAQPDVTQDFRRHYRQAQDALNARYSRWLDSDEPVIRANTLICLIHQANFLLDQTLRELGEKFVEEGGFTERLATLRAARRAVAGSHHPPYQSHPPNQSEPFPAPPDCPQCGQPMRQRTAAKGRNAGKPFWGCTAYPTCKATLEIPAP